MELTGLGIDRHVGVEEEGADEVDSRVLAWAKAEWGALTVKRNIKAVSTECQAQRKYFVKISYNDYPKFNFRHVMLDKYLVGNRGQVRGS